MTNLPDDVTATRATVGSVTTWTITGPLGTVEYTLAGNHCRLLPASGEPDCLATRHADQMREAAQRGDEAVFWVLAGWYVRLPGFAGASA